MLPSFCIDAYLTRIAYQGSREPTLSTLQALHQAHLLAVPFENLSIHMGEPILLYVGDGSDRELTGAKKAGLSPVLVLTSLVDAYDAQRLDVDAWKGRIVQSLNDIPTLL